ncbi:DUF192 domain-containing protein [Candidatus Woesearchaeota archaeon]|nr:DUF192 domain-containing protein [Candidatus Woesearchaeota archaeon]
MKLLVVLFCLLLLAGCQSKSPKVCINEKCFEVELAVTTEQRAKGLMHRTHLDEDKGMLFVFEKSDIYGFWMKNTLIPLDIIWIDENKTIVHINKDTQPCKQDPCLSYRPEKEAKYVLELSAGAADRIGLKIGDKVSIS